jgi:hypothetical protein
MIAAVDTAGTRTETTGGANVQNVTTTMTDPNSWRLGSLHPATNKTEATGGQKIDGTVEMIDGTVEMIVGIVETAANAATATRGKTGASDDPAHNPSDHSKKRWMLIADSTCTKGKTENCAPITR